VVGRRRGIGWGGSFAHQLANKRGWNGADNVSACDTHPITCFLLLVDEALDIARGAFAVGTIPDGDGIDWTNR